MSLHKIRKGLDLPITGAPEQSISEGARSPRVALLCDDSPFLKPRFHAEVGKQVRLGELLFDDRKAEGIRYTAPGAGSVVAIHRGEKRAPISVVIELSDPGQDASVPFASYRGRHPQGLDADGVRALLVESGQWTALRARPFGRVPRPDEKCDALFINAMDTHPLAPSLEKVMEGREEDILRGMHAAVRLTDGPVFFCRASGSRLSPGEISRVQVEEFVGPHPAGLVGTHIHLLRPVGGGRVVWHLGIQDLAAWGSLFQTGRIATERIVALGGPAVKQPRLLRTRLGASTDALTRGELMEGEVRVVSGSVLGGRKAMGEQHGYLGRYHQQISCLKEGREREFLGWLTPGLSTFSTIRAYLSSLLPGKRFAFTTTTHGSERAMVPLGMYERVMPLDILPTFLLRALDSGDLERAEQLGCLELDEEDLALCTFVSPGKEDFGQALREIHTRLWKEG